MAKALMQNEGRTNCTPEELAEADLSPKVEPIRGMGDLYAFLSLHILCALSASEASAIEVDGLRDVQNQIAAMVTMVEEVPGFSKYLFHMGGVKCMVESLEKRLIKASADTTTSQQEVRTISQAAAFDYLIPYLLALNSLAQDYPLALEYMRSVAIFPASSLHQPLDPDAFNTEEEFKEAAEERKVDGLVKKDTFGGKLVTLMISLETNLKRIASEFLWTLCHNSAKEMTDFCGYGAAAHIIAIKAGTIGQIHASDTTAQMRGASA